MKNKKRAARLTAAAMTAIMAASLATTALAGTYIGLRGAKLIACRYAGVSSFGIRYTEAELDREDGVYEIEFRKYGREYDFEIDAYTGEVLKYDNEFGDAPAPVEPAAPAPTTLTLEQAKTIALRHAAVDAANAVFVEAKKDYENGKEVYELEFYAGNVEYDYEIDAVSGNILKFDHDAESYTPPVPTAQVTLDEAKAIALTHAGVDAANARFIEAKSDYEDGRLVYELEFHVLRVEYEYEIDAATGAILDSERDGEDFTPPAEPPVTPEVPPVEPAQPITRDEAKKIALAHAGANVRRVSVSADRERGVKVYEVEFEYGRYEYEYTISVATGEILHWEKEFDD